MKLLISILCFFITSLIVADTLKVGYTVLPPHIMEKDGQAYGPAKEYIEMVAASAGHQLQWVKVNIKRIEVMLKNGHIDFHYAFVRTKRRAKKFHFAKTAIAKGSYCFLAHRDDPITFDEIMNSKLIIHKLIGFVVLDSLKKKERDFLEVSGVGHRKKMIEMVINKRLRLAYLPACNLANDIDITKLRVIPIKGSLTNFYFAFSKKVAPTIIASFDKALLDRSRKKMSYSNYFKKINTKKAKIK